MFHTLKDQTILAKNLGLYIDEFSLLVPNKMSQAILLMQRIQEELVMEINRYL